MLVLEKPKQNDELAGDPPATKGYTDDVAEEDECCAALARSLDRSRLRRAMTTCQWFLTALSVRPGKWRAIRAHLLPWARWAASSRSSSSSENGRLLMRGSSWLNHRRRQLLPAGTIVAVQKLFSIKTRDVSANNLLVIRKIV